MTEQASLSTTLSSSHLRVPFYRRNKETKSAASDLAASTTSHSKSSISDQKTKTPRRKATPGTARSSFLSRVVFKVVPCVGGKPHVETARKADDDVQDEIMTEVKPPPPSSTDDTTDNVAASSLTISPSSNAATSASQPRSPTDAEVIVPPPPSTQLLPEDETDGVTSGAVQPPGSTGETLVRSVTRDSEEESDGTHFTDEDEIPGGDLRRSLLEEQAEEERLIRNGGLGIPIGRDGVPAPLLPPISPMYAGRRTLILDLDETLVHSSFKPIPGPDFIVPVEIESHWHHFHVLKRPGVDLFLKRMATLYEVVVFTASLSKVRSSMANAMSVTK
jgi:carboxy-terminal domain RNA polymerase II polypeptide A small phosphatase